MKILVLASDSGGGSLTVSCAVSWRVIRWPYKVAHLKAEIYNFMSEKKVLKKYIFFVTKNHFEKSRIRFFACWTPEDPDAIQRPDSKKSPNFFGHHFFLVAFLGFKLPGAF